MFAKRFAPFLLFMLVVALGGNGFASKMSAGTDPQQGAVSTLQASDPLKMNMMVGAACCILPSSCSGATSSCNVSLALISVTDWTEAKSVITNAGPPEMIASVPPQTSIQLFRPPRA
tara:strand:- start:458 stop:808 length:351 start_codon:yes stop_codon:yes gene_type:complete